MALQLRLTAQAAHARGHALLASHRALPQHSTTTASAHNRNTQKIRGAQSVTPGLQMSHSRERAVSAEKRPSTHSSQKEEPRTPIHDPVGHSCEFVQTPQKNRNECTR